jgi:hypothetical protein
LKFYGCLAFFEDAESTHDIGEQKGTKHGSSEETCQQNRITICEGINTLVILFWSVQSVWKRHSENALDCRQNQTPPAAQFAVSARECLFKNKMALLPHPLNSPHFFRIIRDSIKGK